MDDINLLASGGQKDDKSGEDRRPSDEETALHVPKPEPPAPKGGGFLSELKPAKAEPEAPPSLLKQKIEPVTPPPAVVPPWLRLPPAPGTPPVSVVLRSDTVAVD